MTRIDAREAKLLPSLLNVLVAGVCDGGRLSRGRTYHRQGAVVDLTVTPGTVTTTRSCS